MVFTPRLGILILVGCIPLAFATIDRSLLTVGAVYNSALLVAIVMDILLAPGPAQVAVARVVDDKLSLGTRNPVRLRASSRLSRALTMIVKDEPPPEFEQEGRMRLLRLPAQSEVEFAYHVLPRARGDFAFGDVNARCFGPLGLVATQFRAAIPFLVRVYPSLAELRKYELLARKGRLIEAGLRQAHPTGAGTEFESLRDYLPDDEFRRINWKATARRGRLTSENYETERSQTVLLMIDAGRLMSTQHAGMSKLDYAIKAAVMLSYVAVSRGDRVGLLLFVDEVLNYLPPRMGRRQVFRIIEALYNAQAKLVEPDYGEAFRYLSLRGRKRSLVVIFTDIIDVQVSRDLLAYVAGLFPAHLPLCVAMRDAALTQAAEQKPVIPAAAFEKAIALKTIAEREEALSVLRRGGALVCDCRPEELSTDVVNRYLKVKARTLL